MITVRLPDLSRPDWPRIVALATSPPDVGQLLVDLEHRYPGLANALDSASVNPALNGEVILSGRDSTPLHDGDEVEFLVMFAGG